MEDRREIRFGFGLLIAAALLMGLWIAARVVVAVYVDSLWFEAAGYRSVFVTMLRARLVAGGIAFLVAAGALLANLCLAYRRAPLTEDSILGNFEVPPERADALVRAALAIACLFVALLMAVSVARNWVEFVNFRYAVPFDVREPVFGHDAGLYVFRLPAVAYVFKMLFVTSLLGLLCACAVYYLRGSIMLGDRDRALGPAAFRHVSLFGAVTVLLFAARFWVARYQLLGSERGAVFGAGYTDVHASLGCYTALFVLSIVLAAWLAANAFLRKRPGNVYAIAAFAVVWLALEVAYPWGVQALVVKPNEWEREEEYIARNMEFTRRAYGLDDVAVRPWSGDGAITNETLAEYPGTVENLQLWDPVPLRDVYNQKQRIRSYYQFADIDVDRYVVEGGLRPVMIAARELNPGQLPEKNRVWTNLHLQYTHGYGLCLSFGNRAAAEGVPEFLISNIPPEPSYGFDVREPRIYYGELTGLYALVHTRLDEFDYPGDPDNFFTRYKGKGGVPLGGMLRRLLLSWYTGDKDILFTGQFTPESRILLFRQIRARVSKLAPFLMFDEDPYPVLHEGRVVWILDGYSATRRFPYSTPVGNTNYLRNSVKATVDAYDGTVTFYRVDTDDPILKVFSTVFPGLVRPLEEMPDGLRAHVRYPSDLFRVQTLIYQRYHVDDPKVFFNGEDVWTFPRGTEGGTGTTTFEQPRYIVMNLPGHGEGPEFVLSRTYTVEGKDNMIAWIAGRCDTPNYGGMTVYRLPKRRNIYGPNQAKGRFNQDPEVSAFTTLMGQLGSSVISSKVLAVPIGEGLLYLQTLLVEDPDVKIPELKQIVVGHGDRVAMAPTIDEALAALFGPGEHEEAPASGESPGSAPGPFQEAVALYQQARERLGAGDWAGFGEAFDRLGSVLDADGE